MKATAMMKTIVSFDVMKVRARMPAKFRRVPVIG